MNPKKIDVLVLTEGGTKIGFGHLTRTYAVIEAFRKEFPRGRSHFEVKGDAAAARYLRKLGAEFRLTDWFGKNKDKTLKSAAEAQAVLIDSYLASLNFCRELAEVNSNLLWLDDYGRIAYPTGKVVVPAPYRPAGLRSAAKKCRIFSGADYAILRNAFSGKPVVRHSRPMVKNILILLGGTGTAAQVRRIVNAIPGAGELNFIWVAPDKKYRGLPANLSVRSGLSGKEMSGLMRRADAAITAGGQTLYELARTGLPVVVFQIAENQHQNIKFFQSNGSVFAAGKLGDSGTMARFARQWKRILSLTVRKKMSNCALKVTDGCGALRIARLLKGRNG